MATDLGKVGMRARGNWNSSATYEVLDVVTYNNGLYIAKQAVPENTAPTNTTYWQTAIDAANIYPKTRTENILAGATKTIGIGSTVDISLRNNTTYILTSSSNVTRAALIVNAGHTNIQAINPLITLYGVTATLNAGVLEFKNTSAYEMSLCITEFIS